MGPNIVRSGVHYYGHSNRDEALVYSSHVNIKGSSLTKRLTADSARLRIQL